MKICFLADSESIHTKRWCNHFRDLGNEIHLISFKPKCDIEGINFHTISSGDISVKGGNWKVLLQARRIKKIIKSIHPDVLHAHYSTSYGIVGAMCNYHPYVITSLGSDVLISPKKSIVYRLLLRMAFSKADWITTMADHMKEASRLIGDFDDKTTVVPFGIDTNIFNDHKRNIPNNQFVIVSTRNFEPVYNIPDILQAISQVKDKIPNLVLQMIGTGSQVDLVKSLAKELELDDVIKFHGRIEQVRIAEILQQSHVFLSVSSSDGNNISLNEAMACGCYPIATDIAANRQWISSGENGLLVTVNDIDALAANMLEVYNNFDSFSVKSYDRNKQIISEKADWNINLKVVEDKYKELTNG
jgi:glycosyltransferase involved in cell wall biosynthesis